MRPAHRVSIMPGGHLEEAVYWTLPEPDPEGTWTPGDAVEAVRDGVREAVRSALVADVPVGSYLSGGLDSSLIVAQMQQLRGDDPVHTFSAGFGEHPQDELPWARRVSAAVGTHHHEVQLRAADFEDLWARLTWHRDAPISEPADIAVFGLARAAREHVRVVLSGEGGDELFAGYPKYRFARAAERTTLLPARLRAGLAGPVERRLGGHPRARNLLRAVAAADVDRAAQHVVRPVHRERATRPARRSAAGRAEVAARRGRRPGRPDAAPRPAPLAARQPARARRPDVDGRLAGAAPAAARPPPRRARLPPALVGQGARGIDEVGAQGGRRAPCSPTRSSTGARSASGCRSTRGSAAACATPRATGSPAPARGSGRRCDRAVVRDLVDRHERGANEEIRLFTLLCLEMWHDTFFAQRAVRAAPRDGATHLPITR